MIRNLTIILLVIAAASAIAGPAGALTLASGGRTSYAIVVSDDAIVPEQTAAKELQRYLKLVTDTDFAIKSESEAKSSSPKILLGQSQSLRKLLPNQDWKSLGADGIIIKTVGRDLILSGGQPRGTLYAVYTFLEDYVGCRWWTSIESTIPKRSSLEIGTLNVNYTPKIKFRESYYLDSIKNPLFDVKLRMNGRSYYIPEEYGGSYDMIGWVHSFYRWIPPEKYFKDHPEWFALVNGMRADKEAQLCLTNVELQHEMARVCLEQIRKKPSVGMITVSQNDFPGRCECDKCRAVEEEEGSPSGPYIRFVNAVADEIHKEYPDFLVDTLAYFFTRKPPLHTKPYDNVIIRLCSIDCNFAEPLDSDANKSFREDMQNWAKISKNMYVWDYVTNFGNYIPPQPNMQVLAPNLRFFEKNNVVAMFEQGDAECSVGDFVRYRNWLIAHLMWNPNQDEKKLTKEFLDGYYGPAAPYIQQYFDVVNGAVKHKKDGLGCIHGDIWIWNFDELTKAKILMDKAESAVEGDKILTQRIRRDRMPIDLLWLLRYDELKATAAEKHVPFVGPTDPYAASKDFIARLKYWNTQIYLYITSVQGLIDNLDSKFGPPPPTPDELKQLPKENAINIEEDKFDLPNPGLWTSIEDDPMALNGKSACTNANHAEWAIKCHIPEEIVKANPGKWRWYAVISCDALKKSGKAFHYGVYDEKSQSNSDNNESLSVAADGKYRTYYLGKRDLSSNMLIWVAPWGNPDAVKGVFVDRIVLVRDK